MQILLPFALVITVCSTEINVYADSGVNQNFEYFWIFWIIDVWLLHLVMILLMIDVKHSSYTKWPTIQQRRLISLDRMSTSMSRRRRSDAECLTEPTLAVQCCVCRMSSVTWRIVAKRCVLEQKLLLTAYMKSYMRNRLVPKWMNLTFV